PGRFAAAEESGEAGHLPNLAKDARGGLDQGEVDVGADVENRSLDRRGALGLLIEGDHLVLVARIEPPGHDAAAGRLDLGLQRLELLRLAATDEYGIALGREPFGD